MTIEEIIASIVGGGVIAIIATYFGWRLQDRSTEKQKTERESRLRSLLANEISSNVHELFTARALESGLSEDDKIEHGPSEILLSKFAYGSFVSDPLFLDEKTTTAIQEAYAAFDHANLAARESAARSKPNEKKVFYVLWSELSDRVEKSAYEALEALGATAELNEAKRFRAWLDGLVIESRKKR